MTRAPSPDLAQLWRAVLEARREVETARATRAMPGHSAAAVEQRSLLAALESYTAALTRHGRPVPHGLHRELAMYRTMFDVRRGRSGIE